MIARVMIEKSRIGVEERHTPIGGNTCASETQVKSVPVRNRLPLASEVCQSEPHPTHNTDRLCSPDAHVPMPCFPKLRDVSRIMLISMSQSRLQLNELVRINISGRIGDSRSPSSPEPMPSEIKSTQPGGGVCNSIELAWGRWRRWYLKRFRRGYVERMRRCGTAIRPAARTKCSIRAI